MVSGQDAIAERIVGERIRTQQRKSALRIIRRNEHGLARTRGVSHRSVTVIQESLVHWNTRASVCRRSRDKPVRRSAALYDNSFIDGSSCAHYTISALTRKCCGLIKHSLRRW